MSFATTPRPGSVYEKLAGLPHNDRRNTKGDKHKYSICRAIAGQIDRFGRRANVDGLEREVSDEIAKLSQRDCRGIYIPLDAELESRALDTTAGTGSLRKVVSTTFEDVLRAKMVLNALGATIGDFSGGIPGTVAIPRRTATTSGTWVSEGGSPGSQSNLTIDQVLFSPKQVTIYEDVTLRQLHQAMPGFEAWVIDDLARSIANELDRVGVNGTGASNQPLGVLKTSGLGSYAYGANGGPPTRASLVAMELVGAIANADAAPDAKLAWLTSVQGRAKMRSVDASSGNAGRWLWTDENLVLGKPAMASTSVPSNLTKGSGTGLTNLAFGNWADLYIQTFSALDVLVNPFLISTSGCVRIHVYQDVDVQVVRPASFVVASDLDPA